MDWWVWAIVAVAIILIIVSVILGIYVYATLKEPAVEEEKFDSSALLKKRTSEYGTIPEKKKSEYDVVTKNQIYAGFPQPEGYGELPAENIYEETTSKLE